MSYTKAEIYGNAALSHDQVRAVRLRRGENARVVAAAYGVAPDTIRKIWRGETYTMVSDEGPVSQLPIIAQQVSPEALQASLQRTLALAGLPPMPASLEEALKAQALREEAASPGLDKLAAVSQGLRRGDRLVDELAGHGNPSVVHLPIPPALGGTSTDGEAK